MRETPDRRSSDACAFTIVSRNYLHFALTLLRSVQEHSPRVDRWVCLCDEPGGVNAAELPFQLLNIRDLPLGDVDAFIFQYTILELNTAIKPYVFEALFERGYDKVVYIDPDIRFYAPLDGILDLLDRCQILLTPHLTGQLDDGRHPNELAILRSGTYNLGFLALRRAQDSMEMLRWWQGKLARECVVDLPRGLFVDQKWMELVPSMFPEVYINRDPGWNVAYWNINHRRVERTAEGYRVDGRPLLFFHFSGVSIDGKVFSKHQDRFTMVSVPASVRELVRDYVAALNGNGAANFAKIPYGFATFANGIRIPDEAREIFRRNRRELRLSAPVYTAQGASEVIHQLNKPATLAGRKSPLVTRVAYRLYEKRPDLQAAFPDVFGAHAAAFAEWFVRSATEQAGIGEPFVRPIRTRLECDGGGAAVEQAVTTPMVSVAPRRSRAMKGIAAGAYRIAWRARPMLRRFVPYNTRHLLHGWLVRHAFRTAESGPAQGAVDCGARLPSGVNVLGYLHAASGVGESGRTMLRALQAAGYPVAALDFRVGNVSRMQEEPPLEPVDEQVYRINLLHVNADQVPVAHKTLGAGFFAGHRNIGYWAWELPDFPEHWRSSADVLDEVWVPSRFCQEAIGRALRVPVLRIPHAIDLGEPPPVDRDTVGLSRDRFLFLFQFDLLSIAARKNPQAVLRAYRKAFGEQPKDVGLVIKLANAEHDPETLGELRRLAEDDPSVRLITGYLSRAQVIGLMNAVDCFVSLHRSEGFGLALAESMYLGKPVIATGWSGNMDFMNSWNSLPVRFRLQRLESSAGPYPKGSHWADPDVAHAAECMRRLVDDAALCVRIGEAARETIRTNFSPAAVGRIAAQRLRLLEPASGD
ncbi:Glycosyltransferase [Thioalkalivibrio nitratireducens DSM 14787]|uniref:Glycosyltransferase n=1 Tax=Thioalkalivibrio nitratireducens (strain DSM 14787 / UNIQEM 213 / ALEN2) TaxID=1255043 RepID=L0DUZ3_THIND|nr:glycosyltransferase [Thioalkalivibrio nitratireducens]AGA32838.1 Glycosyltransferase [Thioalkalivibrio nitratireducens DSM 14787]